MNHLIRMSAALLTCVLFCYATTITVNEQKEYQAIVGFGCHNPEGQCQKLTGELGMSVNREWINSSVGGGGETSWSDMNTLKTEGCTAVVACPWSPPGNYKSNGSTTGGGSVNAANVGDVADFLVRYATDYKTNVGRPLYAISPQNEPEFVEGYESCVYSIAQYQAMVKALGPKLQASSPKTIINVAEDMLTGWTLYLKKICDDTAVLKYVSAISVHGYTDGITPLNQRTAVKAWMGLWNYANGANSLKKKMMLWQTETSGYINQWEDGGMTTWNGTYVADAPGGLALGADILVALKYGHISVWCYWRCSHQTYYQVQDQGVYQASMMFYKFLRPGMINIESTQDVTDSSLFDVAFNDKSNKKLVVVLCNLGPAQKTASIAGTAVPAQFTAYRSSKNESCVTVGSVSGTSIALPTHSITTLVGDAYNPPSVATVLPLNRVAPAVSRVGVTRLYGIDGREYTGSPAGRTHGVRYMVTVDKNGHTTAAGVVVK